MKFEEKLNAEFPEALSILARVRKLSNLCGKTLTDFVERGDHKGDEFYESACHFNRINYEANDSILMLLRAGHIIESVVLLRWHLEVGHLFYYLANNRPKYKEWLAGKGIRPSTIGKFFKKQGFATWFETYADWSNFTHVNSRFVDCSYNLSRMKPTDETQTIALSRMLRDLMFTSLKVCWVNEKLLKRVLPSSEYVHIVAEYNDLEKLVLKYSEEHNERESEKMKE